MIQTLVASLLLSTTQGGGAPQQTSSVLPIPSNAVVPDSVRDWDGFTFVPSGPRTLPNVFRSSIAWDGLHTEPLTNAVVWRVKVVIFSRADRINEQGGDLVWPGHHGLATKSIIQIKRALAQVRGLAAHFSNGTCNLVFDISEETEPISAKRGGLTHTIAEFLSPRINAGRYEAEDGVFRGPYQSVLAIHPVGDESGEFTVQDTPGSSVAVADVEGQEVDGGLAEAFYRRWIADLRR